MSKLQPYAQGYAITAVDIAALRKADRIVCRHTPERGSAIEAIKECKPTARDPFARDVCHIVPTEHRLTDYGRDYSSGRHVADGNFRAFEMCHTPQGDSEWSGPLAFLRAGDVLRLVWLRDALQTQAMQERGNGFHGDRLDLHVHRGPEARFVFRIDCSVCEDNSARMIRY